MVKLQSDFEANRRRTEDLDFSLQKTDGRLVAFDDIYKKFNHIVRDHHSLAFHLFRKMKQGLRP